MPVKKILKPSRKSVSKTEREAYAAFKLLKKRGNPKEIKLLHKKYPHWFVPNWTKEACLKDAKKFTSRQEWAEKNGSAYNAARRFGHKFRDKCCAHMKLGCRRPRYWNKQRCIKNAKPYKTIKEWQQVNMAAYNAALKQGFLKDCINHMKKRNWDKARCFEVAKTCKNRAEWKNKNSSSYYAALRLGIDKFCCKHMIVTIKRDGYWTKERCLEDAKKYRTLKEWRKKSPTAHSVSYSKYGIVDEASKHMIKLRKHGYWTKELILSDAKKFKTRNTWNKGGKGAYAAAKRNGKKFFELCCDPMKK